MGIEEKNLRKKVLKENKADLKESELAIQQELPSKTRTMPFTKITITGVIVFFIGLFIQFLIQSPALPIPDDLKSRLVTAIIGITLIILFGLLVIDILSWRDYTEWGALGAIITIFGVVLIFIIFPLNIFWYGSQAEFVYMIMIISGVLIMIIGVTTRATELDQKIMDQFFLFKEWIKAGGIQQAFSALGQLIGTILRGFFRYIGLGFKELGTRIQRFGRWLIRSSKFVLESIWIFITKTFPNTIVRAVRGLWNNLHWFGLIAVIVYLITIDIPISNADPLILKAELLLIVSFFFCLGVLYPQRDRIVVIAKNMSETVLTGVISAYSMLSGAKIKTEQSVFCSRCLRGIESREFKSLAIIKGMIDPPCPFCGYRSWIGSEKVVISKEELKQTIPIVPAVQETPAKDLTAFEVPSSDKKAIRKGKFPNFQTYTRAQNLGAQNYSELEFIDRLGAPDFETAEKIKKGGYSHFETYKKGLAVGASFASELYLVEELQAPHLTVAKGIQKGDFPDYQSYQRAQELGVKDYSDLQYIERYGAPDFETAEKVRLGGFSDFQTFEKARSLGASTASELSLIEKMNAPDLATAKQIQKGRFPDYQTYKQGQKYGVQNYYDLGLINRLGAPNLETAEKIRDNGFPDYKTFQRAQDIGAHTYSEFQFMTKKVGITSAEVETGTQAMVTEKLTEVKPSKSIAFSPDNEVKVTLIDQKAVAAKISILELGEKVTKFSQSIESATWNIEWRDWFVRQTEKYQDSQIGEITYKHMLRRLQDQYLHKVSQMTQQHDKHALNELQTLVDGILTGKTALILDNASRTQIPTQDAQIYDMKIEIDKRDLDQETIIKDEIWFSEERESLKQAIVVFDRIFSDQFIPRDQQESLLWEKKKKWFWNQKKRFLRGNISSGMFYNKLKSLNEYLHAKFRIPDHIQIPRPREQVIIEEKFLLVKELLNRSRQFTTSNKEIQDWYNWFASQTDLYFESKIDDQTFRNMIKRSEEFYLDIDTEDISLKELHDYEEILSLIHNIQKILQQQITGKKDIELLQTTQVTAVAVERTEIISIHEVIEGFDSFFDDESLIPKENRKIWEDKKRDYYQLRAQYVDFGEISGKSFCSHLKNMREFFITEIGIHPDKLFDFNGVDIDYNHKTTKPQKEPSSIPSEKKLTAEMRRKIREIKITSEEKEHKKLTKKEKFILKQAINNFDTLFSDDALVDQLNLQKWYVHKKDYYHKRARYLDFSEISDVSFYSYLQRLREALITEIGIPSEKLFDFKDIESDYTAKKMKNQLANIDEKKITPKKKEKKPATEKEKRLMRQVIECIDVLFSYPTRTKFHLEHAIGCIDALFSDDSISNNLDFQNWNEYKKDYYHKRAQFLNFGEINDKSFYSYLKKLSENFIAEINEKKKNKVTKKCPSCGIDIFPETSQYCTQCGTKLPD